MGALMERRFRNLAALACSAMTIGVGALSAQKPKSPKETQAILAVQAAQTPDDKIKAIENVLTNFADTEFKIILLQMALQSEQQKGDYAQTVFYAQRLLDADPKNAVAMVTLAGETARHTREFDLDKDEKLAKVDKWAKDGVEAAKTMPKPRPDFPDDQMELMRKDTQEQGYEALGMGASLRKKYDDAIADFKQAISVSSSPDPATYVRLGQAYEDAGKLDDASEAFDKALNAPNVLPQVKSIAQTKKLEVAKRKAGGAPTPQP
jgi:tetratricopeptide (TPR) repeat protein